MTCDNRVFKVALLAIALVFAMNAAAYAACGEASCVAVQGTYVSHFSGANCTGTESYYLKYDNYGYQCRTWNGTGECGTASHSATNRSYRINNGACQNEWPGGNTLDDFVTVYRNAPPPTYPPVACGFSSFPYGTAPYGVSFFGSCSYDPDGGSITGYSWWFGDGSGWGAYSYHTYWYPGTYSVWLTVYDDEGQSSTAYIDTIWVQ